MSKLTDYRRRYGNEVGDTIPVVIFCFHNLIDDLWLHKSQYEQMGKFKGVLKGMHISIRSVKKVFHVKKTASSFPTQEWQE